MHEVESNLLIHNSPETPRCCAGGGAPPPGPAHHDHQGAGCGARVPGAGGRHPHPHQHQPGTRHPADHNLRFYSGFVSQDS